MNYKKVLISFAVLLLSIFSISSIAFAQESTKATVTTEVLNLRSGPDTTYQIIGKLSKNDQVIILGSYENWYIVNASSLSLFGWVVKDHISLKTKNVSRGDISRINEEKSKSSELISYSKTFLGVNYVWGGTTPDGFDCSGFVQYVYKHFGIELNRVACDQAKQGVFVEKDSLAPGDLVFFNTNKENNIINHVGMYIGNGQFIHASSGHGEVMITDLTKGYYNENYVTGRRILN